MNLISRVKRPLALAALVLTLVLSGTFPPSSRVASTSPCPEQMIVTYYYTDDTYTVEVKRMFGATGIEWSGLIHFTIRKSFGLLLLRQVWES